MSKNTQISELINYLSFDGSGNIFFNTVSAATTNTDKFLVSDAGTLKFRTAAQLLSDIGAQASGSYQAALSGTGFVKISGSTISYDNSTYLTTASANSTYLPLTGGTLTGALSGTSGTFSGNVLCNNFFEIRSNTASFYLENAANTVYWKQSLSGNDFNINHWDGSTYTNPLTIASTGAATFLNSVTAPNAILGNNTNNTNSIKIIDNASTKTYIGSGFGAAFINNNSFFNGTAYVFDDAAKPNSQITLSAGGIFLSTGAANTDPTSKVAITNSGNVGIGVTPSAWGSVGRALQIGLGSFWSDSQLTANLSQNHYFSSAGRKYIADGYATDYEQYNGYHAWKTAPYGTAGDPISFSPVLTIASTGAATFSSGVTGRRKYNNILITSVYNKFKCNQYKYFTWRCCTNKCNKWRCKSSRYGCIW